VRGFLVKRGSSWANNDKECWSWTMILQISVRTTFVSVVSSLVGQTASALLKTRSNAVDSCPYWKCRKVGFQLFRSFLVVHRHEKGES
jgi:hypothetical protein